MVAAGKLPRVAVGHGQLAYTDRDAPPRRGHGLGMGGTTNDTDDGAKRACKNDATNQ